MERWNLRWGTAQDDLVVTASGALAVITGPLEVNQAIGFRLRLWEGERWLVPNDGVPYERYFEKGMPHEMVLQDVLMEIYSDERIEQVTQLEIQSFDAKERRLTVYFEAVTVTDETLKGQVGA